jgi:hypothetical protein
MSLEHLESDVKLILTDYINRRCIKMHNDPQQFTNEDETLVSVPVKNQLEQSKQNKSSPTTVNDDNESNTDLNESLFKVRTRGLSTRHFERTLIFSSAYQS